MIGSGPHNGFRVKPRNIDSIRIIAEKVSDILGISKDIENLKFDKFLDDLSTNWGIDYVVLSHDEMLSGVEAYCIPDSLLICIRQDVYENACLGVPRDRFTIIHEIGHLLLGHKRTINRESTESQNFVFKMIEDSEWQANQFAAEILMPYNVIKELNLNTPFKIQNNFNVSLPAAVNRFNQLSRRGEI